MYVAVFLMACVFWYAIEKVFMRQIGFSDGGIGVMVAAYSAFMLLLETPSGIIADRWSRKGVLIIASVALALSSWILGVSNDPVIYIAGILVWTVFYALYSGTDSSIIYDTLLEETGSSKNYEHFYGYNKVAGCAGLVVGSLFGGVIAQGYGYRAAYFVTIPVALASIICLLVLNEPKIHKSEEKAPIKDYIVDTFKSVLGRRELFALVAMIILLIILDKLLFEFSQLWYIALAMPVVIYGIANALVAGSVGIGGVIARFSGQHRTAVILWILFGAAASSVCLVFVKNITVVIISQMLIGVAAVALEAMFSHELHDQLSSRVRAGASSALCTVARFFAIPLALIFGFISDYSVFAAGWELFAVVAGIAIIFLFFHRK